jgi:hypothetical protein
MIWWKKSLLFSAAWVGLTIGTAILHTDVFLAGQITPEQDGIISYRYGAACGLGLIAIWAIPLYRRQATFPRSAQITKLRRFVRIAVLIAAAAYGLYSFVGLIHKNHIRDIDRDIGAAFEDAQKLPPGHERGQDIVRRLKAINMDYAPPEMKQAVADYLTAFQQVLEATEAGHDASAAGKAMEDARDRMIVIEKKHN